MHDIDSKFSLSSTQEYGEILPISFPVSLQFTAEISTRRCLLRHFNEKLLDEVFAVIWNSSEAVIVELPVTSSHVV